MSFARDVVRLEKITADRTEKEGIEKMGDQGNLDRARKWQAQPVDLENGLPANYAEKKDDSHEQDGEEEVLPIHHLEGGPESRRAEGPGDAQPLPPGQGRPIMASAF